MLADRALQVALRNLSTLILVVAVVTVPLHLVYSFVFRDVIAVSEIHDQIEQVGPGRKVRNVGAHELRDSRTAYLALSAIELATLPLLIRVTRRVIDDEESGVVPGAWSAWGGAFRGPWIPEGGRERWVSFAVGVAIAVIVAFLIERTVLLVVQMLDPDIRFVFEGLARAIAIAFGAPFGMVPLALGTRAKGLKGQTPNP
jgi:hypothetical protein